MNRNGLLTLYTYNAYANNLVFDVAGQLSDVELTQQSSPSHNSVLRLLQHLLATEAHFLEQCRQQPVSFDPFEVNSVPALRRGANELAQEAQHFITTLNEAELTREIEIQIGREVFRFPRWQPLLQSVIHATHHRGELSVVLSALGHPLPTLDIIIQLAEESGQVWPHPKNQRVPESK
jgi:uncharacterized damage-inducible protein DinB